VHQLLFVFFIYPLTTGRHEIHHHAEKEDHSKFSMFEIIRTRHSVHKFLSEVLTRMSQFNPLMKWFYGASSHPQLGRDLYMIDWIFCNTAAGVLAGTSER